MKAQACIRPTETSLFVLILNLEFQRVMLIIVPVNILPKFTQIPVQISHIMNNFGKPNVQTFGVRLNKAQSDCLN